jgi:hypothetical protein
MGIPVYRVLVSRRPATYEREAELTSALMALIAIAAYSAMNCAVFELSTNALLFGVIVGHSVNVMDEL